MWSMDVTLECVQAWCAHGAPSSHKFYSKATVKKRKKTIICFGVYSSVLLGTNITRTTTLCNNHLLFFSVYLHAYKFPRLPLSQELVSRSTQKKASHSRGWRGSERAEWSQRSNKPRSPCTMSVTRMRREKKEEFACLPPSMCVARAPQKEKRPRTVAHERPALVNWGGHSTSVCTWVVIAALSWCGYRKCEAVVFRGKPQDLASAAPPTANWWHTCTTCYQHSDSHR